MLITNLWDEAASTFPAREGLIFETTSLPVSKFIESIRLVAGKLAHELDWQSNSSKQEQEGVSSGIVGVCMENSDDLVIIASAILYAGFTYLPLDVNSPRHRIATILGDSSCSLLITDRRDCASFQVEGLMVRSATEIAAARTGPLDQEIMLSSAKQVDPCCAAYCIYTSGSTGLPKGVAVSHNALLNHTEWMINQYDFVSSDRFLFKTPCCFDASVWELFTPLACGGCLIVAHTTDYKDPIQLAELVISHRISVLQLVPSIGEFFAQQWNQKQDSLDGLSEMPGQPMRQKAVLRHLFFGGEPLKLAIVRNCAHLAQSITNLYGPTECCIDSVVYTYNLKDETSFIGGYVPIGSPIRNTEARILATNGDFVAELGVPGELVLSGACVAIGYLGKTPAQMDDNPFTISMHSKKKMYRTGDFVQWIETDGGSRLLHCLGRRNDSQTKLHGYRVDLHEVECCVQRHPFVEAALAVVVQEQLVVFVQGNKLEKAVLLAQCRTHLPLYMVPSQIHIVPSFPRLPSGKLDLRTLMKLSEVQQLPNGSHVADCVPMSDLEKEICVIAQDCSASISGILHLNSIDMMLAPIATILDSIGIVKFQQKLLNSHEISVSIHQLYSLGNLSEICNFLARNVGVPSKNTVSDEVSGRQNEALSDKSTAVNGPGDLKQLETLIRDAISSSESKIIVVHSSLAHLELPVEDICQSITAMVREYTASNGNSDKSEFTFLFPAFTFGFCRYGYYHHVYSRSETGILSHFVQDALPSSHRTFHPLYSWVVIGKHSQSIGQCDQTTAFGERSVFAYLDEHDADFLLLGCEHLTQIHYFEEKLRVPYRYFKTFTGRAIFGEKEDELVRSQPQEHEVTMYVRDLKKNPVLGFKYVDLLRECNAIESRTFNHSFVHFVRGRNLRECLGDRIKADPNALVIKFDE